MGFKNKFLANSDVQDTSFPVLMLRLGFVALVSQRLSPRPLGKMVSINHQNK